MTEDVWRIRKQNNSKSMTELLFGFSFFDELINQFCWKIFVVRENC